jgi:hypothetical protein
MMISKSQIVSVVNFSFLFLSSYEVSSPKWRSPCSLNDHEHVMSFWSLFLGPNLPTHNSNMGVSLRWRMELGLFSLTALRFLKLRMWTPTTCGIKSRLMCHTIVMTPRCKYGKVDNSWALPRFSGRVQA